jgi:Domain of unknown function (DUF6438)
MTRAVICLIAATVAASDPRTPLPPRQAVGSPHARDTTPIVTLSRSGCRGFCPAYTIVIGADRWVRFTGTRNVRVIGRASRRLTHTAMARLRSLAAARPLAPFDSAYAHTHPLCADFAMDLPGVTMSMRTGSEVRQVHYEEGCMNRPPKLDSLARTIDSIAGTSRWLPAPGERPQSVPTRRPS